CGCARSAKRSAVASRRCWRRLKPSPRSRSQAEHLASALARARMRQCASSPAKRSTTMATATKQPPVHEANHAVRVEIFDQGYNLRGSDPEYILKLAEYVDAKMRAVAEQTQTVDTARLAVLAALNIADEFHLLKRNRDHGTVDYLKRAQRL